VHKKGGEEVNFITKNAGRGRKCSRERKRSLFNKRERERDGGRKMEGMESSERETKRTNGDGRPSAF